MVQHGQYPDAYYRVSLKAIIRNNANEVLCVKEGSDWWESPGGGVEHGEDIKTALTREFIEEIAYTGNFTYELTDVVTLYDEPKDRCIMFIGVNVVLTEDYTATCGPDVTEIKWIDPAEFKDADARGTRMIARFAYDTNIDIEFARGDGKK